MPSNALQFRSVCGCFLPRYIIFMSKRADKKKASRTAMLTLARRLDGVLLGFTLTYLFWGGILLRCGDIETNPGPTEAARNKEKMQTRLSTTGGTRKLSVDKSPSRAPGSSKVSVEKPSDSGAAATPTRPELTLTDVMATLTTLTDQVATIGKTLDDVKKDVRGLHEDYTSLASEFKGLRDDMAGLQKDNEDLHKKNSELCAKLEDYESRLDDLEGRSKRNNLLFYGLYRREGETSEDLEGNLRELITDKLEMGDDVNFDRAHRLNSRHDSPVIARCVMYKHKVKILKNKRKLQGTSVFIGEDFTRRVRDIRKRLAPHLKHAKQAGKKATMTFDHLLIDGKRFDIDGEDKLYEKK